MAMSRFVSLVVLVIVGTLILSNHHGVSAQCEQTISQFVTQCLPFVAIPGPQIPPSAKCCAVVKSADIPCVCKQVTPGVEKLVSMKKVIYVARTCGAQVPAGMKCGSYTIPPAKKKI